ncbi:hypothetical protein RBB79_20940 [Tunturiibacter empetritectus]|uniref:Uncharacterized protein n=2 Tax=Tunturiibacter TaxID=3154218 RepID=A0A852VP13_9BACT|nr:hypothetical protein [Edaphobacter lichenicola]NYF92154.1 hypothetical protein [Edaphobacter lichenicola]
MAASEGFHRITTLGRRIAVSGALVLLLGFFIRLWESRAITPMYSAARFFLGPGYLLMLVGGLLLIVAWIGEGFIANRDSGIPSA